MGIDNAAKMNIPANTLRMSYGAFQEELDRKYKEVLERGWYILGSETENFEKEFAAYIGVRHCIGLASGLDALILAFRLLGIGPGDEVIVASNAYIACVMGITINGAVPAFVEPDSDYNIDANRIESGITQNTKAILAVHLYGKPCKMDTILAIARKYHLKVVEDCAQSHGAGREDKYTGAWGDISCFSFYPTKNLGAFGDGGCLATNSQMIADQCRILRNYGSKAQYEFSEVGMNSRLDELQAGFLRVKLKHLNETNHIRCRIAQTYLREIKHPEICLPEWDKGHVWHQFVVRTQNRNGLKDYLAEHGINSAIHYPIPPHLSACYASLGFQPGDFPIAERYANEVLSLPIYQGLTENEAEHILGTVNAWRNK
jgi:dTDP-4-amino-4,6-dideoxygalactose transaminase